MTDSTKVLIVDDDPGIRLALHDFLAQNGFTDITRAANGFEALKYLRANTPQLIISDITMPQMDGYAFVQELHNDVRLKSIPVIVLTGRAEMAELFRMAGIHNFLIKPVEPKALLDLVLRVLGRKGESEAADSEHFLNKIEEMENILTKNTLKSSLEKLKKIIKGKGP